MSTAGAPLLGVGTVLQLKVMNEGKIRQVATQTLYNKGKSGNSSTQTNETTRKGGHMLQSNQTATGVV